MSHIARENLVGFSFDHDRLWLIETPEFTAGITEYNEELTGYDQRFGILMPGVFKYGGNAYYILGKLADEMGWKVIPVEDRR